VTTESPAERRAFSSTEKNVDFRAPAEMYTGRQSPAGRDHPYRRFPTLVEAVQFAIERQPSALMCTTIETDEARLQSKEIQAVYNSASYRAAARTISRRNG
jgi:hypothetical protein